MDSATARSKIEAAFRKQARKDPKVRNAYLLVHSDKLDLDLRIAEGRTGDTPADIRQPVHMASVGKIFTATVTAILHEQGRLSFDDRIAKHLDPELMQGLHVHKGKDYSAEITVRHLLTQSSGLNDCFWVLLKKLNENPELRMTPRDAVTWGKRNQKPKARPGQRMFYTDTNYYLLGLLVEAVTGRPFHETLHRLIFTPLAMDSAYMMGWSEPAVKTGHPPAGLYINDINYVDLPGIHGLDYAGGGVMAELADYLKFMQALVGHRLVKPETLQRMLTDDVFLGPNFRYGYSTWKLTTIPLLLPAKFNCWGCVGASGAFMFHHPGTGSHVIGSFGDVSYRSKALLFMIRQIIRPLLKCR